MASPSYFLKSLFFAPVEKDRRNNINAIRFIAAAMVIYGHMAHLVSLPVPSLFGEEVSSIAVKVFFVLSGYLIAQSYLRDSNWFRYYTRRIFRIIPGLLFVAAVTAFIIGPAVTSLSVQDYFSRPEVFLYFIQNTVLYPVYNLPGVFENNPYQYAVNGSLWTLPVEFSMYIILPFALLLFRNRAKYGLLVMAIVLEALNIAHFAYFPEWSYVFWGTDVFDGLPLVPYFFVGAFFAHADVKLNLQIAVLLAFLAGIAVFDSYAKHEVMVFLVLPYLTMACSMITPAVFGRVFAEHDYSYGLYLWGFPTQQILVMMLGPGAFSLVTYALIATLITLAFAMASWHLVENPSNRIGKKLTAWSRNRQKLREATTQANKKQSPVQN